MQSKDLMLKSLLRREGGEKFVVVLPYQLQRIHINRNRQLRYKIKSESYSE